MALVLADRVKESTTTAGTGTVTLLGAAPGFQSFAVVGNTNTTYYTIAGQTTSEWEVGIGTYTSSGTTLARTTVLSNSAGTQPSALSFSAGTKDVFVTYPAGKSVNLDASNNATALGTPVAFVGTNITGTAIAFTASNVTTNANLTGAVTSVGNATSLGSFTSANLAAALTDETGSGANVFATSPTLVTPVINGLPTGTGVATAATASTLVARDASGNFAAGTITAALVGNASTSSTAPSGNSTGTNTGDNAGVTSVTGTAPIVSSGTNTPAISIVAATTLVPGSMSAADKTKLDGVATGATANTGTVTSVGGTGTVSGLTLSGSVSTSGNLTLGGAITGFATGSGSASGTNTGDQTNISGNAATATNVAYTGLTGTVPTWNQSTTGNAATATTLSGDQSNWASLRTSAVANMLGWKNYSNAHVIFDASASTSPTGSAVNNTNAANAWSGTLPTLMGWNGSTTYGVRVDVARISDSTSGNAATATNVAYSGLTGTVPTWNQSTTGNAATVTNFSGTSSGTNTGDQTNISGNSASTTTPTFSGDAVNRANITLRTDSGFYEHDTATIAEGWPVNSNTWQHMIASTHSNDANYYSMQISGSFFDDIFYGRKTSGSGTSAWVQFLTSGNFNSFATTNSFQMGALGVGVAAPAAGAITASGNITANSDERLKANWRDLPLDFIEQLAKVKHGIYDRTDLEVTQIGVSAQALREVSPESVLVGENGILSVAYGNAALVAAIQLAKRVVDLEARIEKLERNYK